MYVGLGIETTASSMFRGAADPRLDPIGPSRRIDPDAPLVAGTIGGRPVVLARPDQHGVPRSSGTPDDMMVPLTLSRLRRAIDLESGKSAAPYRESLTDYFPLAYLPIAYETAGVETSEPAASWSPRPVPKYDFFDYVHITAILAGPPIIGATAGALLSKRKIRGAAIGAVIGAVPIAVVALFGQR